tara:strand:- start:173 stop:625 length:453 start_codon:yes stop_codon:yes gene_type:complete
MIDTIKYAIYGIFAYLSIDLEVFSILMILMLIDSLVGAIKAVRLGEHFRFRTLLWGITMKFIFLIIPLTLALIGKALDYDLRLAVDVVFAILTVAEAYSIFGNIYSAKNRIEVTRLDVVSVLIVTLRRMMRDSLDILFDKMENIGRSRNR